MKPIFLRRSLGTASGSPKFMRQGRNVIVPECGDAMSHGGRLRMRRHVAQFGGPWVVFVVRSVVVTSGHIQLLSKTLDLVRLGVGFLGELVSVIGVFQCPF